MRRRRRGSGDAYPLHGRHRRHPRGLLEGAIFTAAVPAYSAAQRQLIYDAYTKAPGASGAARGYTHMAVHLGCRPGERSYHAIFPPHPCDGAFLSALLREMYEHTPPIIPICFVMDDVDRTVNLRSDLDRSLCRLVVPKWEYPVADCDLKAVREAFPDALLYWENRPASCRRKPTPARARRVAARRRGPVRNRHLSEILGRA